MHVVSAPQPYSPQPAIGKQGPRCCEQLPSEARTRQAGGLGGGGAGGGGRGGGLGLGGGRGGRGGGGGLGGGLGGPGGDGGGGDRRTVGAGGWLYMYVFMPGGVIDENADAGITQRYKYGEL